MSSRALCHPLQGPCLDRPAPDISLLLQGIDEAYDAAVLEAEEASRALNDYLKEVGNVY